VTPPAPPPLYRRLPGRRRGLATSATLWQADDHLLVAEVRFWTESYRRIYYRDIQAIALGQDGRWLALNLMFLTFGTLLLLVVAGTQGGWRIFWAFPAALVVLLGSVHFLRGPTCACEVTTPLATLRLPLQRVRPARRTLALVRSRIEAAQGTATREKIVAQAAEGPPAAPPAAPILLSRTPPPLVRPGQPRMHAVLCAALVLDAMVTVYQWPHGNTVIDSVAVVTFFGCVLASIFAIVAQNRTDLGPEFRWFGVTALGAQILLFVAGWIFLFAGMIKQAGAGGAPQFPALFASGTEAIGPYEIAMQSILALWGLVVLLRWRRARKTAWISLTT